MAKANIAIMKQELQGIVDKLRQVGQLPAPYEAARNTALNEASGLVLFLNQHPAPDVENARWMAPKFETLKSAVSTHTGSADPNRSLVMRHFQQANSEFQYLKIEFQLP